MFFIQACQGDQLDHGVKMVRTEHDAGATNYRFVTCPIIWKCMLLVLGKGWKPPITIFDLFVKIIH